MPTNDDSPTRAATMRVIPREQHGISRKNISLNALRVLYRLSEAGFQAYLVGGAVRDLLLAGIPRTSTWPPMPRPSRCGTCSATAA